MPTVRVTKKIDTFAAYGQPFHAEPGDILDGDLANWALATGLPVEIDVPDPAPAKPTPAPVVKTETPPAAPVKRAAKKTTATAAPAKRAAKKTTATAAPAKRAAGRNS